MENQEYVIERKETKKDSETPSIKPKRGPSPISWDRERIKLIEDICDSLRTKIYEIQSIGDDGPYDDEDAEGTGYNMAIEIMMDIIDETEEDFIDDFKDED